MIKNFLFFIVLTLALAGMKKFIDRFAFNNYLNDRINLTLVEFCILLFVLIIRTAIPGKHSNYTICIILFAFILSIKKLQRMYLYSVLLLLAIVNIYSYTFHYSQGLIDATSDRDDAVVIATNALLNGENPWTKFTQLNNPITTGFSSIIIAIPSVMITGDIILLTMIFWTFFILHILFYDLQNQSNKFPLIISLFVSGFGYIHETLHFSLEEYYFGILFFGFAHISLLMKKEYLAGVFLSVALLNRISYFFLTFGFIFWAFTFLKKEQFQKLLIGTIAGLIAILFPFAFLFGDGILSSNPFIIANSFSTREYVESFFLYKYLNRIDLNREMFGLLKLSLFLAFSFLIYRQKKISELLNENVFAYITVSGILMHSIIWTPPTFPLNYYAMFTMLIFYIMVSIEKNENPKF